MLVPSVLWKPKTFAPPLLGALVLIVAFRFLGAVEVDSCCQHSYLMAFSVSMLLMTMLALRLVSLLKPIPVLRLLPSPNMTFVR